jgi:hypothetical protein
MINYPRITITSLHADQPSAIIFKSYIEKQIKLNDMPARILFLFLLLFNAAFAQTDPYLLIGHIPPAKAKAFMYMILILPMPKPK